jgi:Tfp pilus assembly protein PilV
MLVSTIVVGVAVLAGLAIAIGRIQGGAQDAAWRRIAQRRRELADRSRLLDRQAEALGEKERELWAWETELVAAAAGRDCPVCELRRGRGERPVA